MAKVKHVGRLHQPIHYFRFHSHHYWEVVCYTKGTGIVEINGEAIPFSAGDVFIIPPEAIHSDYSDGGFQNYHYEFEDASFPFTSWLRFHDTDAEDFLAVVSRMYTEYQLKRKNYREIVDNLYNVLFYYIIVFSDQVRHHPYVDMAINDIVANFSNPMYDFRQSQAHIHMNPDYFRRLFIREVGVSPLQYLTEVRLSHAKRLLHLRPKSGLSIQEISWMSGFRDNLYFSRAFKKATGFSPKNWDK